MIVTEVGMAGKRLSALKQKRRQGVGYRRGNDVYTQPEGFAC
jgi:hypothetical protein